MTGRENEFQALYHALRIRDQKQYYDNRCEEYEAAHRQTVVVRNALLVIAALAGAAGQFTGPTARGALAVVAAVAGALAAAVPATEQAVHRRRLQSRRGRDRLDRPHTRCGAGRRRGPRGGDLHKGDKPMGPAGLGGRGRVRRDR
jgi:hypothetical protein